MIPLSALTLTRARQSTTLALHSGIYDRLVLGNMSQDILDVYCGSAQIRLQAQEADVIELRSNTLVIVPTLNSTAIPTAFTLQISAVQIDEVLEAYPQTLTAGAIAASGSTSFDTGTLANGASVSLIAASTGKTPFVTSIHIIPVAGTLPTVAPATSVGEWLTMLTHTGQRVIGRFGNHVFGEPVTAQLTGGVAGDMSDGVDIRNDVGAAARWAGVATYNQ